MRKFTEKDGQGSLKNIKGLSEEVEEATEAMH